MPEKFENLKQRLRQGRDVCVKEQQGTQCKLSIVNKGKYVKVGEHGWW